MQNKICWASYFGFYYFASLNISLNSFSLYFLFQASAGAKFCALC